MNTKERLNEIEGNIRSLRKDVGRRDANEERPLDLKTYNVKHVDKIKKLEIRCAKLEHLIKLLMDHLKVQESSPTKTTLEKRIDRPKFPDSPEMVEESDVTPS